MQERRYWVYIVAGAGRQLYIGVTNDLERRVYEHKHKIVRGFTAQYNIDQLVYYAEFGSPRDPIAYEKKLKGWVRRRKVWLIEENHPNWEDLAANWYQNDLRNSAVTE